MKKLIFLSLLACSAHAAQIDTALGIGYRSDCIGITPFENGTKNIRSAINFDDFNILNLEGSFRGNFDYFVLMADGSYGRFWDGRENVLFAGPVQPLIPFSSTRNDVVQLKTAGYATSASGGGGFLIPLVKKEWIRAFVIPKAGYRRDNIRIKQMNPRPDPITHFDLVPPTIVSMHFIDLSVQKFELAYEGPFFGGDFEFEVSKFKLLAGYTYHWPRSRETAKFDLWILEYATNPANNAVLNANVLVNAHTKRNRGHMFKGKIIYQVLENFYLSANGKYVFYKKKGSSARSEPRAVFDIWVPVVASNTDLNL